MAILDAALWSLGSDTPTALRAVLFAEQVLGECPPPDITSHRRLLVIIAGCKGRLLLERGDLSAASTALADGIRAAREGHFDGAFRELTGMRALVEAIVGRLRRASELALGVEPVAGSTSGGNTVRGSEAASLALAWIRTDESRAREAQDLLNRAQAQEVSYDSRVLRSILVILRARSLCTRGELDIALADLRAERSAHPAEVTTAPTTGWLQSALLVAEAQVLTSLGQPDDAATLLRDSRHRDDVASEVALQRALLTSPGAEPDMTRLLGLCREEAPLSTRIERSLLLAETLLAEKDQAGAEQFLAQALRLGADELLRRPFREAGPRVTGLLLDSVTARRSRWLHTSRDTPPQGPTLVRTPNQERNPAEKVRVAAPMVDSLTTKEGEVLGHLAELLTTEEIAAAMFVSVNTVRTHVRSILRKLAVMRRNDAVRRAWDLGLLVRVDESDYRSAR
jgi:LuxR family maltose regulon positive regulatory protein